MNQGCEHRPGPQSGGYTIGLSVSLTNRKPGRKPWSAPNYLGTFSPLRESKLGQRANMFRIGIDLGGTKIEGIILDADRKELLRRRISTRQEGGYQSILERIKA